MRQGPGECRRKIEMTPGAQSRDDTPVGGGYGERGRHNPTRGDGVSCSAFDCLAGLGLRLPSGEYRRLGYCVGLTCGGARLAAGSSAMICCKHSMPYWVKAVTPCSPTPQTQRQPS